MAKGKKWYHPDKMVRDAKSISGQEARKRRQAACATKYTEGTPEYNSCLKTASKENK